MRDAYFLYRVLQLRQAVSGESAIGGAALLALLGSTALSICQHLGLLEPVLEGSVTIGYRLSRSSGIEGES